jgi:hypothetical protein
VAVLETTGARTLTAPGAASVALWLEAWLRGGAGADDLLAVLASAAPDTPVVMAQGQGNRPLEALLRDLRALDVVAAWPLLPRAGSAIGWPRDLAGPPVPAVLLVGPQPVAAASPEVAGLHPDARGVLQATLHGWAVQPCATPLAPLLAQGLSPRAGARRFTELLDTAARDLARLGLERPPTGTTASRWGRALVELPASTEPALGALLHRIATVLDALELALGDDGAAVTAAEARARASGLHRLHGELVDLVTAVAVGVSMTAPGLQP